jgi:DNA-binding response OmpR family regulator
MPGHEAKHPRNSCERCFRHPDRLRMVHDMAAQRVLVVDDEPTVRDVVARYLERDGYVVREIGDGAEVMAAIESFHPDLVVLDVMLPGRSGLEVLRDLGDKVPVILLTARTDETDRVLGLELGADDYVVKPFSPRELVARVRSVLRRSGTPAGAPVLTFDELRIDTSAREVRVADQVVALTAKEFDVLAHLAAHPRQVFSRAQLLASVWDSSPDFQDPATVTVHVRRVRNKIERDPEQPRWIATVWGVGYRFEP